MNARYIQIIQVTYQGHGPFYSSEQKSVSRSQPQCQGRRLCPKHKRPWSGRWAVNGAAVKTTMTRTVTSTSTVTNVDYSARHRVTNRVRLSKRSKSPYQGQLDINSNDTGLYTGWTSRQARAVYISKSCNEPASPSTLE